MVQCILYSGASYSPKYTVSVFGWPGSRTQGRNRSFIGTNPGKNRGGCGSSRHQYSVLDKNNMENMKRENGARRSAQ